ncbi:MAG: hypothetical protein LW817_04800, partial [Candidatus Caenarcaniphilales bacterium]|nr:hypothetical protein [Candidatus Caenarcaniphilales bacterium]
MLRFLFVMMLSPKPSYKSGCSPAEAALTLEWAKKTLQDTSIDQNEIPILTYVVENLTELLNDYGAGRAVFEAM